MLQLEERGEVLSLLVKVPHVHRIPYSYQGCHFLSAIAATHRLLPFFRSARVQRNRIEAHPGIRTDYIAFLQDSSVLPTTETEPP